MNPRRTKILHLYPPPQPVDPSHAAWRAPEAIRAALRGESMHAAAYELPRITIPRTRVNSHGPDSSPVHRRLLHYEQRSTGREEHRDAGLCVVRRHVGIDP